jgi:hypothetical protein
MSGPAESVRQTEGSELRPGRFCRYLVQTLDAAEGQTKRRKRDQSPDRLGLALKRELLERAAEADPPPEDFERWLMAQILAAPSPGPVRAMCEQIFLEYRMVGQQPEFAAWLAAGAPSDDAEPDGQPRRASRSETPADDRWRGIDDAEYACTCHLPLH